MLDNGCNYRLNNQVINSCNISWYLIDECFKENMDSIGNDIDIILGTFADPIKDAKACQKLCQ